MGFLRCLFVSICLILFQSATGKSDSSLIKKILWEFDFNQPSFFAEGFFDGGAYYANEYPGQDIFDKRAQFKNPYANPVYNFWQKGHFTYKDSCMYIKRIIAYHKKTYDTYEYLFLQFNERKRTPDQILVTHYTDKGKIMFSEAEGVEFDENNNPVSIKHYYNKILVYIDSVYSNDSRNRVFWELKRQNFYGKPGGMKMEIIFQGYKVISKCTYSEPWSYHFKQRIDSAIYFYELEGRLQMHEKYYDIYYLKDNDPIYNYSPNILDEGYQKRILKRQLIIFQPNQLLTVTNGKIDNDEWVTIAPEYLVKQWGDVETNNIALKPNLKFLMTDEDVTQIIHTADDGSKTIETFTYSFPGSKRLFRY